MRQKVTVSESIAETSKITDLAERFKDHPDAALLIDSGYYNVEVSVYYQRPETDEEMAARLEAEQVTAAKAEKKKEKDRRSALREFNRLKKEYGFK